jgi:hypothetical protein
MSRKTTIVLICALIASLCATTAGVGATTAGGGIAEGQDSEAVQKPAVDTFLGFRTAEELRFVLERADGERSRMYTAWRIWLAEADQELGVFELAYEVGRIGGSPNSPEGQVVTLSARTLATAWINAYGFPTKVRFTTQRNTPMGGIEYTVEYRYEDQRFIKELQGFDDDQKADLDGYRGVDPTTPAGAFLFMPVDAECVAASRLMRGGGSQSPGGTMPPGSGGQPSGGGGAGGMGGGRPDMEPLCQGREPIFANPALLNLAMPALWESGTGAVELLAFAPTGVIPMALMGGGGGGGSTGINVGGFNLLGGGRLYPFGEADDAFQPFALNAESELIQIDVGGRPVDVFRLVASAPLDSVYVDGNGSIVRLDLPADPETGERFWIRRLRPSEY